ncbi:helix-turn-helix domain-containing protein [Granulicella aggregans]|jgi:excisionase family DNA binding protein|uniref:helix-turn-helix domain-containing protein n=1 Tax=Granulicella aggregans TaxID=474949 RepID=UPI0021E05B61|nr:helix-turn-helix domain-containing protein [Granulicella aggregans]
MFDEKKPPASERLLPIVGRAGVEALLDSHAAAALLGVHPRTLQRMVLRGQITGVQVGKLWRFRASAIDHWIDQKQAG